MASISNCIFRNCGSDWLCNFALQSVSISTLIISSICPVNLHDNWNFLTFSASPGEETQWVSVAGVPTAAYDIQALHATIFRFKFVIETILSLLNVKDHLSLVFKLLKVPD